MTYEKNHDSAAAMKFMRSLFDESVAKAVGEIARLPDRERRAAMKNPRASLERFGLRAPSGVSVAIMEARRPEIGVLDPDHPGGGGVRFPTCIRLCVPMGSVGLLEPKICVWVCV